MTETTTDLQVTTPEAAENALHYARTAMLPAFSVTYTPKIPLSLNRDDLQRTLDYTLAPYNAALRLQEQLGQLFRKEVGDFSAAQQHTYQSSSHMYPFVRKACLEVAADYFTSAKDANDLVCLAAEIGSKLKEQLGSHPTVEKIIHVYQKWINTTFRYESTGRPEDHSAVSLMRRRTGVCQAIAALTVLVLPHLGLHTLYISGQGGGREGLAPHAWNLIRVPAAGTDPALEDQLPWHHVDFTFGMNDFTPHTLTSRSAQAFSATHAWNEAFCTQTVLNRCLRQAKALQSADITLHENKPGWQLGDISVTSPRAILIGSEAQGHWVDLLTLLRFLGGGCEYIPSENRLRIVLHDRQFLVDNGRAYLGGPEGYLKVSVLQHLPLRLFGTARDLHVRWWTA